MTLLPILWSALPKLQLDVDLNFYNFSCLFWMYVRSNRMVGFSTQNKISESHNSFSSESLPVTFMLTKSIQFSRALKQWMQISLGNVKWCISCFACKQLFKPSGQPDVISWPPINEFDWLHWSPAKPERLDFLSAEAAERNRKRMYVPSKWLQTKPVNFVSNKENCVLLIVSKFWCSFESLLKPKKNPLKRVTKSYLMYCTASYEFVILIYKFANWMTCVRKFGAISQLIVYLSCGVEDVAHRKKVTSYSNSRIHARVWRHSS